MDENMVYKTAFETIKESTEWGIESEDKAYGQFVDGVIAMSDAMLNKTKNRIACNKSVEAVNDKSLINISFEDMIYEMIGDIKNGICLHTYYWKTNANEYEKITECDLIRGRIVTEDGDFSEFDWEIEDSRIYREAI